MAVFGSFPNRGRPFSTVGAECGGPACEQPRDLWTAQPPPLSRRRRPRPTQPFRSAAPTALRTVEVCDCSLEVVLSCATSRLYCSNSHAQEGTRTPFQQVWAPVRLDVEGARTAGGLTGLDGHGEGEWGLVCVSPACPC